MLGLYPENLHSNRVDVYVEVAGIIPISPSGLIRISHYFRHVGGRLGLSVASELNLQGLPVPHLPSPLELEYLLKHHRGLP